MLHFYCCFSCGIICALLLFFTGWSLVRLTDNISILAVINSSCPSIMSTWLRNLTCTRNKEWIDEDLTVNFSRSSGHVTTSFFNSNVIFITTLLYPVIFSLLLINKLFNYIVIDSWMILIFTNVNPLISKLYPWHNLIKFNSVLFVIISFALK